MNTGHVAVGTVAPEEDNPACQCCLDGGEHVVSIDQERLSRDPRRSHLARLAAVPLRAATSAAKDRGPLALPQFITITDKFDA
jgi:hypothetical protein